MKKLIFSTLALCLLMSSCSNNLLDGQLGDETDEGAVLALTDSVLIKAPRLAAQDIRNIVREEPLVYGNNVQVFESYAAFDSTINLIEEMCPAKLKVWAQEHNIENEIIESNVVYDSVFQQIGKQNGLQFDSEGMIIEPKLSIGNKPGRLDKIVAYEKALEQTLDDFDIVMHELYPQYIHEFTDSLGNHFIESLGIPNEDIFKNDKNLYVIDSEVHRTYPDGAITCAFSDYKKIARFGTVREINQFINREGGVAMLSAQFEITWHSQYQKRILSGIGYDKNSKHAMQASFSIAVSRAIFGLDRRSMRVLVTNYSKNKKGNFVMKSWKTNLKASFATTAVGGADHTFTFDHKNCWMRNRQFTHSIYKSSAGDVYITSFNALVESSGLQISGVK